MKFVIVIAAIFLADARMAAPDAAPPVTQAAPPAAISAATFSAIRSNPQAHADFDRMIKGYAVPKWVTEAAVNLSSYEIMFDGRRAYVLSACKQHNCNAEQVAVLHDPDRRTMYGLLLVSDLGSMSEKLVWWNIGGGKEATEGRAILYTALTGNPADIAICPGCR